MWLKIEEVVWIHPKCKLTLRKCASPESFHELIHLNKGTLQQQTNTHSFESKQQGEGKKTVPNIFYSVPVNMSLISVKLLLLTVKHVGGGSSFIRMTAAGGTGKTPPGTGCKPGAAGRNTRSYVKDESFHALCSRESSGKMHRTRGFTGFEDYVRARWRGWKGIIWFVSGLGYSGLRSTSSFKAGTEGATTVSGRSAASLARDTSYKQDADTS